jgi:hypothetical protein
MPLVFYALVRVAHVISSGDEDGDADDDEGQDAEMRHFCMTVNPILPVTTNIEWWTPLRIKEDMPLFY